MHTLNISTLWRLNGFFQWRIGLVSERFCESLSWYLKCWAGLLWIVSNGLFCHQEIQHKQFLQTGMSTSSLGMVMSSVGFIYEYKIAFFTLFVVFWNKVYTVAKHMWYWIWVHYDGPGQVITLIYLYLHQWPLLLTWFDFNLSRDK